MCLPDPTKRPTPSELGVIAGFIAGVPIALGVAGLAYSLVAPPEKHDIAVALRHYSFWSLGLGAFIALAAWLTKRLAD